MKRVTVNGKTELHADEVVSRMRVEQWFIAKLERLCVVEPGAIASGETNFKIRQERIRDAILKGNLGDRTLGKVNGQAESWAQSYYRFYGEHLQTRQKGNTA